MHCHIDLYKNYQEVVSLIQNSGMYCLCVTTAPSAYLETKRRIESKNIRVGLGIHPEVVGERSNELPILLDHLPGCRYVGEIGLDGSRRFRSTLDEQKRIVTAILSESRKYGPKMFSLHSRASAGSLLDILGAYPDIGPFVLHWFSGSKSELRRAIDLGCWFSVGPAMLLSKSGQDIAAALPKNRLLTETDGPFTEVNGRTAMPTDVSIVLDYYAKIWGNDRASVEELTFSNFKTRLNLLPKM